jgi:hypothetical protein
MNVDQLNAIGKNKEQIKQELLKKADVASKGFIEKEIKDAYSIGYADGFNDALAHFGIKQNEVTAVKSQLRG